MVSDGVHLCIQVVDPFGRLERGQILAGLTRGQSGQMDQRNGGAGLGIALCYGACTALIYDVVPQAETGVIGVFELDLNRREFRNRPRSLHLYSSPREEG
jgi:hypothetical protein